MCIHEFQKWADDARQQKQHYTYITKIATIKNKKNKMVKGYASRTCT